MSTYGIWLSAAGMQVNEHRQTLLANNMANANTAGFKQDMAVVRERKLQSHESPDGFKFVHSVLDGYTGGAYVRPSNINFSQGDIEQTSNPLDVAIDGDGFLMVSDGTHTRYTRNGKLALNHEGYLVLAAGEGRWKVLDDVESPIQLDERLGDTSITTDGTIYQNDRIVATLGLRTTHDKQSLRKYGETLFDAGDTPMTPASGRIISGAIEQSNYDIMKGLASMIEASRAYEMNANLLRLQDQAIAQAVNTVGRLA